jgi:hypothetical protein
MTEVYLDASNSFSIQQDPSRDRITSLFSMTSLHYSLYFDFIATLGSNLAGGRVKEVISTSSQPQYPSQYSIILIALAYHSLAIAS